MQVGDLVRAIVRTRYQGMLGVAIRTHNGYYYNILWENGETGWFTTSDLEVVCK